MLCNLGKIYGYKQVQCQKVATNVPGGIIMSTTKSKYIMFTKVKNKHETNIVRFF